MSDSIPPYSTAQRVIFWLWWLLGMGICVQIFLFSPSMLLSKSWPLAVWSFLVAGGQGYGLVKLAQNLSHREKPMSQLLLGVVFLGLGVPMIATGGCTLLGVWLSS
ncbi:MAG: hypothetical protein WAO71_00910 [Gallionella sp.]